MAYSVDSMCSYCIFWQLTSYVWFFSSIKSYTTIK